jgi:hypothetical protein|tara:strand:- start:274 stop:861 length:588 start_codon:yes stop_codon:yes gene_type:complete
MDKGLFIDYCSYEASKFAVLNYHYSKAMPSGKLVRFGVWEDKEFIGSVLFGSGANPNMSKVVDLSPYEVCELVRVALNKHKNPVSKIVSFCMKKLKKDFPRIKAVVSYADPMQNHKGKIYQAMNWLYLGETKTATHYMLDGKFYHSRSLNQKNRDDEAFDRSKFEKVYLKKYKYIYLFDKLLKKRIDSELKEYIA